MSAGARKPPSRGGSGIIPRGGGGGTTPGGNGTAPGGRGPAAKKGRGGRPAKNGGGGGTPLAAHAAANAAGLYGGNARAGAGPDAVESREEDDRDIMDGGPAFVAEAKAAAQGCGINVGGPGRGVVASLFTPFLRGFDGGSVSMSVSTVPVDADDAVRRCDLRPGPSSSVMAMAGTNVPTFTVRSLNEWSPSADGAGRGVSSSSVMASTLGVTATYLSRSFVRTGRLGSSVWASALRGCAVAKGQM